MSNVLPQESQRTIWRNYRARFILMGSLVTLSVAALSSLALLPSYLALHSDQGSSFTSISTATSSGQGDREAITSAQSLLVTLSPHISATTTPTAAVQYALALRPKGATVNHIVYSSGDVGTIMLVGLASREVISAYRTALSGDPHFKSASVPIGDLAGAQDGGFSITLSGDF